MEQGLTGPRFVAVGPQRTGSSWLDQVLRRNPDVEVPRDVKETFAFQTYDRWDEERYCGLFEDLGRLRGEVSPTYFTDVDAMRRIRDVSPDCTILIGVRHPVDRAISHYRHLLRVGDLTGDMAEAWSSNPAILDASRYERFVPEWQRSFGAEGIHFVSYDRIVTDPDLAAADLADSLGVGLAAVGELPSRAELGSTDQMARSPFVARLATRTARVLRSRGIHSPVNLVKRLGGRSLLRGGSPFPAPDKEAVEWLSSEFTEAAAFLSAAGFRPKSAFVSERR